MFRCVFFKLRFKKMSEPKQASKITKSKSRKNQVKGQSSAASSNNSNVVHNNYSISSTNISYQVSGLPLTIPTSSILGKIDMEHLKQATFRNIKSSLGSPSARDDCINYALEMVISNLIINGRLDPAKAQNMRTPLMKAQIASICDKMLKSYSRTKKPAGSTKSSGTSGSGAKKAKTVPPRPKQKAQKWAYQPAALPITVVTDQLNHNTQGFVSISSKSLVKKVSTGSIKVCRAASIEALKKKPKKKKCKSLEPSALSSVSKSTPTNPQRQCHTTQQHQNANKQVHPPSLVVYQAGLGKLKESVNKSLNPASSEVPSYQSVDYSALEAKRRMGEDLASSNKPDKPTVQLNGSVIATLERDKNQPFPSLIADENLNNNQANGDKLSIPFTPVPYSAESRSQSAADDSRPSSTKTLNALLSSSSISNAGTSSGFQILVDMKGFQNDEISMEVEGRQLIFLASRPKRNDLNVRKVTEIVDVPTGVNLENLKIGRRVDGFVIVEEFEADAEPQ